MWDPDGSKEPYHIGDGPGSSHVRGIFRLVVLDGSKDPKTAGLVKVVGPASPMDEEREMAREERAEP